MPEEIIDQLSRDSIKKIYACNLELKSKVEALSSELDKIRSMHHEPTQSPEQDKLLTALAAAKAEMSSSSIERSGYIQNRGNYATLDDIRLFIDPILSKHGLTFRTEPVEKANEDYLKCIIGHSSGQWYSSMCKIRIDYSKSSDALQALGKALTSMKRYVYGTFFMIHTGGDKD